jgi:hypothetical protein
MKRRAVSQPLPKGSTKDKNIAGFCCIINSFSSCTRVDDVVYLFCDNALDVLLLDNVTALLYSFYPTLSVAFFCEQYQNSSRAVLQSTAATDITDILL